MAVQKMRSAKKKRRINNVIVHTSLAVLAAVWVFPIIWVVLTSFRATMYEIAPRENGCQTR